MLVLALELELPLRQLLGDPCTQEWRLEERELLFEMASLPMGVSIIVGSFDASTDVTAMVTWVDYILLCILGVSCVLLIYFLVILTGSILFVLILS